MPIDKSFEKPLALVIEGSRHAIGSIREAAWVLADKWPDFSSAPFRRALAACGDALEGKRSTSYARRALLLAAHSDKVEIVS
jgi:hypothetical protein